MRIKLLKIGFLGLLGCASWHFCYGKSSKIPQKSLFGVFNGEISTSKCAQYFWKDRGRMPISTLNGFVEVFKGFVCEIPAPLGSSNLDTLTWLKIAPTTYNLYATLMGLSMRESSGKYCEGRDLTANNVSALTAEAGMFQFSYNSMSVDPKLRELFEFYKQNPEKCLLEMFSPGVVCKQSDATIYGRGEGAEFQKLARSCPRFAVEYAAIAIRKLRKHWGPINRKEVEIPEVCVELLKKVECT